MTEFFYYTGFLFLAFGIASYFTMEKDINNSSEFIDFFFAWIKRLRHGEFKQFAITGSKKMKEEITKPGFLVFLSNLFFVWAVAGFFFADRLSFGSIIACWVVFPFFALTKNRSIQRAAFLLLNTVMIIIILYILNNHFNFIPYEF